MLRFRSQAPASPAEVAITTRVYITNLNYYTSEEELFEYLKDWGVTSVVIPCQIYYGIRGNTTRSLGIAYADFETPEKAKFAMEKLYNVEYKGRYLKLKPHVPYVPRRNFFSKESRKWVQKKNKSVTGSGSSETIVAGCSDNCSEAVPETTSNEEPCIQSTEITNNKKRRKKKTEQLSNDTLYCHYLPQGTTDKTLREYFKEYNPSEIWIFKTTLRGRNCFPSRFKTLTSALIKLNTLTPLDDVIQRLKSVKLHDKKMILKVAFVSKILEVKKIVEDETLPTQEHHVVNDADPANIIAPNEAEPPVDTTLPDHSDEPLLPQPQPPSMVVT